jgi:flagellar hook-associated protein 2
MKAEGIKLDRLRSANQLTQWKQTAYYNTTDIIKTFSTNFLSLTTASSARLASSYLKNATTVKNSSGTDTGAVKITGSSNVEPGNYTMDVKQLAQKDTYSGVQGSVRGQITGMSADVAAANVKVGDTLNISLDGTTKTITFSASDLQDSNGNSLITSGEDFKNLLQSKLTAAFGTETVGDGGAKVKADIDLQGRLIIKANAGHTASIAGGGLRDTTVSATDAPTDAFGLHDEANTDGQTFTFKVDGQEVSFTTKALESDTQQDIDALVSAINKGISEAGIASGLKATAQNGKLTFSVGSTAAAVVIDDEGSGVLNDLGFSGNSSVTVKPTNQLAQLGFSQGQSTSLNLQGTLAQTFGTTSDISFTINDHTFTFESDKTLQEMMNEVSNAGIGVKLSYDGHSEKFNLESTSTGSASKINFGSDTDFLFDTIKLNATQTDQQKAQDAIFNFNGVMTTRDSNNFEINGIRMELTAITGDENGNAVNGGPVSINVTKDTAAAYDMVNGFIEAYNTMIDGVKNQLNTSRPKKDSYNYYEPLTDEQKEAMSDRDVENWEKQAQTGLLKNDDLLTTFMSQLRGMLYQPVTLSNGNKLSLYEIGITTSTDYRDSGKLVVDETKLRAALETRAADVSELFAKSSSISYKPGVTNQDRIADEGIAERMNDIINNSIGTSGSITRRAGLKGDTLLEMSSTMYKQLSDQNTRISEMLEYLQNKETSYYEMFSRMEAAITEANNQMAYLQAQLL